MEFKRGIDRAYDLLPLVDYERRTRIFPQRTNSVHSAEALAHRRHGRLRDTFITNENFELSMSRKTKSLQGCIAHTVIVPLDYRSPRRRVLRPILLPKVGFRGTMIVGATSLGIICGRVRLERKDLASTRPRRNWVLAETLNR